VALPSPIRVLILDPRLVVRLRLRALVDAEVGLEVVGEAGDAARALDLSRAVRPDLVLLESGAADAEDVEVCRQLLALRPRPAVVMLPDLTDQAAVRAGVRAGTQGALRQDVAAAAPEPPLSARRRAILSLVAEGLSNREIAARTNLSALTVKGYVEEILEALGARNRVEAAVLAIRRGLIPAD
jgi:DNA-binding NarL/FixJ family response regulator